MEPLIETWRIAARLNPYLWQALSTEQIAAKAAKGKTVLDHFGHIHAVRLMWLKEAAPDLRESLDKVEDPAQMFQALEASANAIEELIRRAQTPDGRVKGFKPHVSAFVGYLIAHESYHRAQVDLLLRLVGLPVDDKTHYGVWEWGVR